MTQTQVNSVEHLTAAQQEKVAKRINSALEVIAETMTETGWTVGGLTKDEDHYLIMRLEDKESKLKGAVLLGYHED